MAGQGDTPKGQLEGRRYERKDMVWVQCHTCEGRFWFPKLDELLIHFNKYHNVPSRVETQTIENSEEMTLDANLPLGVIRRVNHEMEMWSGGGAQDQEAAPGEIAPSESQKAASSNHSKS